MAAPDPKDPRFRPYRAAAWALYLVVAVGFSLLVTVSVYKSVLEMTPDRPRVAGETLTVAQCVEEARSLWDELELRRRNLGAAEQARHVDQAWSDFRMSWLRREREIEARCAVDAPGREKVRVLFSRLEEVLDNYTTATVQFAGGVGPSVDAFKKALDEARP